MASKLFGSIASWIKEQKFVLLLITISLFLAARNYQPETWLSGWDTLHPEFSFSLYFKRIFFGVWQEHQGLGAVASQAHPAELVRMITYYPLSFFLSPSFLRYSYFFLTLILGPLGVYYFLEKIVIPKNIAKTSRQAASFCGGLLYLLNLGTLQHYYLPLEMFATQYAALGWLFLWVSKFFKGGQKKNLLWLAVTTLLAAPAAHTATLFFVYFLGLSLYVVTLMFFSFSKKNIRKGLAILSVTFLLNCFWLLPNLYFIKSHGQEVVNSKIHRQFSQQAFLTGQKFGTLKNTAFLKNFLFDWGEYDDDKKEFVRVFNEWTPNLKKPIAIITEYSVFFIVALGILISIKKKNKYAIALLPIFLVSFSFITNNIAPTKIIFSFCQEKIPLFKEALRFPFTKFSLLLMFSFAVYFSIALSFIYQFLEKHPFAHQKNIVLLTMLLIFTALGYYMLPAFTSHLISPSMKVKFPSEYFESFQWLNQQEKTGRIAPFPLHTFRGWQYYLWGYEGAGFEWFGLSQPLLAREFDRWSPYNENYYWEISYAFYSGNLNLLESVLEKYQVHWLWVDKNIFDPSSAKGTYFDELTKMLSSSSKISLKKEFGKIKIYEVSLKTQYQNFISLSKIPVNISPKYNWNNYDLAYLENEDYLTDPQSPPQAYYPFRSLFTGRSREDLEFSLEDKKDYFLFKAPINQELPNYYLDIPPSYQKELLSVTPYDLSEIQYQSPEIYYNGNVLEVIIPKEEGYFSANIEPANKYQELKPKNCDQFSSEGIVENKIIQENGEKFLRLSAINAYNCSASFWLPNLSHQYAYLISVESRNLEGQSFLFWLENLNIRKADIESYLPLDKEITTSYFIQPPMEKDSLGYALHFDNISIGQAKATNDLGKITVNLIPFNFLTSLKIVPAESNDNNNPKETFNIDNFEVYHPNPSFYKVKIKNLNNTEPILLTLSQSFEKGWLAFQVKSPELKIKSASWRTELEIKKLKKHVLFNNWANGWIIDNYSEEESQEIIIFFWPQLLEYWGFLIIPATLILIKKIRH